MTAFVCLYLFLERRKEAFLAARAAPRKLKTDAEYAEEAKEIAMRLVCEQLAAERREHLKCKADLADARRDVQALLGDLERSSNAATETLEKLDAELALVRGERDELRKRAEDRAPVLNYGGSLFANADDPVLVPSAGGVRSIISPPS